MGMKIWSIWGIEQDTYDVQLSSLWMKEYYGDVIEE